MSYCIYVGKNLCEGGHAFLAGYGDEPSSHWLEIVPSRRHPDGTMITVGVTHKADFPGQLTQIPQVARTAKYIATHYSYYKGLSAPLINGGLNEHHVAVRDVWSPSRRELREITPANQTGLNYSDLARIVLERATTAREGVEIIGDLIGRYGYATYGGNSHMIADSDESWIVIEFAGGQGLWAAERLGPDDLRVSRPGYIGEFPMEYQQNSDYLGDGRMQWPGVAWISNELWERANRSPAITLRDMMWALRTPKLTGDTAGYGQVVELRPDTHPELGVLWHVPGPAISGPFVPFYLGATDIPPEFKKHRYLTADESALFISPDADSPQQKSSVSQSIESTHSAFRVFKRLFYLTMQHHEKFLPEVTETLDAFEATLIQQQPGIEKTALTLYQAGEVELARNYLTYFSNTEAMRSLRLAEALSDSIEARTKLLFDHDDLMGSPSPELLW